MIGICCAGASLQTFFEGGGDKALVGRHQKKNYFFAALPGFGNTNISNSEISMSIANLKNSKIQKF